MKIVEYLKHPSKVFIALARRGFLKWIPDIPYLKIMYKINTGGVLNLDSPVTFNEKLQWLKIYDRKPIYTMMVDKYLAKEYVAEKIGVEHIIPTLGVWECFEDIDFDKLPNEFVLKCTHDSGGLVICRDKATFDKSAAEQKIKACLKKNFYDSYREWPYKNVKPRIIAEKYMTDTDDELRDYKFFCFNGQVKCFKVDFDRFLEHHANYYDAENNLLMFGEKICPPIYSKEIVIPENIQQMKKFAELLSSEIPFLRADFYDVDGKVYFGELTFYPATGMGEFTDDEWDITLGKWIKLPSNMGGYILIKDEVVCVLQTVAKRNSGKTLTDYKFFCFEGSPQFLYVSEGLENHETASMSFLTLDWAFAPFGRSDYKTLTALPKKPVLFDEMLAYVKQLCQGIKFVRIDLYEIQGVVYFSEITFYPCSGFMPIYPIEWDNMLGEMISLPTNGK